MLALRYHLGFTGFEISPIYFFVLLPSSFFLLPSSFFLLPAVNCQLSTVIREREYIDRTVRKIPKYDSKS